MITLKALCAEMTTSRRSLTPRGARDWWTKGLLPKPMRRGLGQGKGTETYWTDPRVLRQAQAAHDLMAQHARAGVVLWGLWLLGFPISLDPVRATYEEHIDRALCSVHGRTGWDPSDVVGEIAGQIARLQARKQALPAQAREAFADMGAWVMGTFYGVDNETATEGVSSLWDTLAPHLAEQGPQSESLVKCHPTDENFAVWAQYLKDFASLPAQKEAIRSASDYELLRARRVVLFVAGHLRRFAEGAGQWGEPEKWAARFMIVFGGWAIPILVAVLRENDVRDKVTSSLLTFARTVLRQDE